MQTKLLTFALVLLFIAGTEARNLKAGQKTFVQRKDPDNHYVFPATQEESQEQAQQEEAQANWTPGQPAFEVTPESNVRIPDSGVGNLLVGLAWDTRLDCDSGFYALDAENQVTDYIYYSQKQSTDGSNSIRLNGDNLTGDGSGDDETTDIWLSNVLPTTESILVMVNMYTYGSIFNDVPDLKATIYVGGEVFATYLINPSVIPEADGANISFLAQFYRNHERDGSPWYMRPVGGWMTDLTIRKAAMPTQMDAAEDILNGIIPSNVKMEGHNHQEEEGEQVNTVQ